MNWLDALSALQLLSEKSTSDRLSDGLQSYLPSPHADAHTLFFGFATALIFA